MNSDELAISQLDSVRLYCPGCNWKCCFCYRCGTAISSSLISVACDACGKVGLSLRNCSWIPAVVVVFLWPCWWWCLCVVYVQLTVKENSMVHCMQCGGKLGQEQIAGGAAAGEGPSSPLPVAGDNTQTYKEGVVYKLGTKPKVRARVDVRLDVVDVY